MPCIFLESWLEGEVQRWEFGRRKLAAMMGADPESFSEEEVASALNYVLPSRLSARDTRPFLKVRLCCVSPSTH